MGEHFSGPVAAKALIVKDGKILVVHSHNEKGKWELPGGHLDVGEGIEEALKRECMEELGVEVSIGRLIRSGQFLHKRDNKYMLFVTCEAILSNPHQTFRPDPREVAQIQWIDKSMLDTLDAFDDCKDALKAFWKLS